MDAPLTDQMRIGGVSVNRAQALAYATRYLTEGKGWGYPAYDAYDSARAQGPLNDADLLAPVLLNIGRAYSIPLYEGLKAAVPRLQAILDRIPLTARLATADDAELATIGEAFGCLDGDGIHGARGTVLAKILHRKRPSFIPLYDRQVHAVYVG
ncbi:MAG: DUF6308 family protein, partial [Actinomycetota bacterium]|nr:DUF6308 family protein [Actinomycetota bacterium]